MPNEILCSICQTKMEIKFENIKLQNPVPCKVNHYECPQCGNERIETPDPEYFLIYRVLKTK